ncbi:MAG TPA: phosphatidylglycerophosphatase A [Candidatus Acidoferrales bacterium]
MPGKKPRFAIFIATAGGLGYFPKAPGTLGSLAGLLLAIAPLWFSVALTFIFIHVTGRGVGVSGIPTAPGIFDPVLVGQFLITIFVAALGVWSASRAAQYWQIKDPQRVVIDEVSGQHLTLLLGCGIPLWWRAQPIPFQLSTWPIGLISSRSALNWKYLLVGFILFRLFDIWKPAPARQAEALPGGWGIMADDWIAGVYAAIGLWLARAAGL